MLFNNSLSTPVLTLGTFIVLFCSCAKPTANFIISETEVKAPAIVAFENNSNKAESYVWDFGDGTTSTAVSPEHKYILSGNYEVTLKAIKGKKESTQTKEILVNPPQDCLVEMETSMGTMTILLYDKTAQHRDNFIKLAETGYYDGLLFHRVINDFMIQGGDPKSKNADQNQMLGSGGPGYQIPAEFDKSLHHIKGALAAARTGGPGNPEKKSSGSQFYIVHGKKITADELKIFEAQKNIKYSEEDIKVLTEEGGTPFLDQEYTVFGRVIKGLDVIDKIAETSTGKANRPVEDVKIIKVRAIK